ncbi:MAG: tRNA (guanosine(37)-N1)-methyltransferase TrmD [Candidatus Pacebacteria bacterium]|nr:tRNA (guanosine(37)-N1)-methyltransferase TrmD [Candidatus Paceibacterota bacterium]
MKINFLTLFPEYFINPLQSSIIGKAVQTGKIEFRVIDIRDYAQDKHRITDERPYGGGAGMVLKVEPIDRALADLTGQGEQFVLEKKSKQHQVVLTSAKGQLFNQDLATEFSKLEELTIICGHYEGVDERVAKNLVDQEIRIGDYVLTGGEPAGLVIADAVTRLLPGVLGNAESLSGESHQEPGVLGHPQYTRPREYRGWVVPEVLLTGDHQKINQWREDKRE